MHRRLTPSFAAALALVALASLASAALACGGAGKTTAAMPSCCSAKSRVATACAAQPAAPAACASKSATASVVMPAPVTAPFAALPNFAQPTPLVSGLMAFLDPETGLLTGPIGDLQAPTDLALTAPVELTPVPGIRGGITLDLQGTLMDNYVLTIDPLGRRSISCVQDARKALAPAAPILATPLTISPISER